MKAWLDDFCLHQKDEAGLLEVLEIFMKICREKGLKISALKSVLFATCLRWCGRIIDSNGVKFDPRQMSGLQEVHLPKTAAELCEYVHCIQWVSPGIPDFADVWRHCVLYWKKHTRRVAKGRKKSISRHIAIKPFMGRQASTSFPISTGTVAKLR